VSAKPPLFQTLYSMGGFNQALQRFSTRQPPAFSLAPLSLNRHWEASPDIF
jgi:hypothetical protein